uniref:Uncharacterized protein n=1 Tax=Clastoptera arizonana TaxID=38151 RepID=A0A1B6DA21_9HEMI
MDRGKSLQSSRGGKSKTPQFPTDLYVLGSKASGETKRTGVVHGKPGSSSHSIAGDRKREAVTSSLIPAKKPKTIPSAVVSNVTLGRSTGTPIVTAASDAWESIAVEVEAYELIQKIFDAYGAHDSERVTAIICGAIRSLKLQRNKPDMVAVHGLMYIAKSRSAVFHNEHVMNALCSLIRLQTMKVKNVNSAILGVNLLMSGYKDVKRWPEVFVKLYMEDALSERIWVDNEECKGFIDNIMTAFSTKAPPALELETKLESTDDPEAAGDLHGLTTTQAKDPIEPHAVLPRFATSLDTVESTVLEIIKETLNRRQGQDSITKNFLKLLSSTAGLVEVRVLAASRLEMWLQNPKLLKPAQELLMSVCVNCTGHTQKDVEVISSLVKIRLKSKAIVNYYLLCIRELITAHSDNLATVLKHTIYNELSQSRNPNNLAMLAVMFQYEPDEAATILADIFQELLLNRDDYLRPLRALLREIWRTLRSDLNLSAFCRGLMSQTEPLPRDCDYIQRAFLATADLITLCIFLATASYARPDKKEAPMTLDKMQHTIAGLQGDAVWWFQETAIRIYRPTAQDFILALHKILLMEQPDQYYKLDNWPPESDRTQFMRLASEVPLLQNILLRIFMIGLSKEHPLSHTEALELGDQLVKRAANITNLDKLPALRMEKIEIMNLVFNLCAYHHPENIDLPVGYTPPLLAITNLYWKGWILLLIVSAHNPDIIGAEAWNSYPTLHVLMEMCITNHFIFPTPVEELQMLAVEKQAILQFEVHLAAASTKATITEQTSLLLSQLISNEPKGMARRPPPAILEMLQVLNQSLRLGHLLCRSRRPDFLVDIIQRQGTSQSMPWLADLVNNSDASLNHLPVQCLCEFLLSSSSKQQQKYQQLLTHLQIVLTEPSQDISTACEVLEYFLRRLSSPRSRTQAITGLKLVLSAASEEEQMETNDSTDDAVWLLRQLPLLPHFPIARTQIITSLRMACQVENDPSLVTAYLCFLAQHLSSDLNEMSEVVVDMAQLIVERSTIMAAILPAQSGINVGLDALISIFYNYLNKAREPSREEITWSESQDQIFVTWQSGEQCTLHILAVHAMVILLTYGDQYISDPSQFQHLLYSWFPVNRDEMPKAYLVDTSEEALLIPDWLKLRMIRSRVPRLVDAALTDLEPPQLILFIQSFGIPVTSMTKLLEILDHAVMSDELSVGEAVLDKAYMVQLVEVQHRRGASGGHMFARVLGLQDNSRITDVELEVPSLMELDPVPVFIDGPKLLNESEIITLTENLFIRHEDINKDMKREYFQSIQKTLALNINYSQMVRTPPFLVKSLIIYLLKKTTSDKNFVKTVASLPHIACPLFRLLTTVTQPDLLATLLVIVKIILVEVKSKPLIAILKGFLRKHESRNSVLIRSMASTDNPKEVFEQTPLSRLEAVGNSFVESQVLGVHGTENLVEALANLLISDESVQPSRTGQFIDWFVQLEPEIIGASVNHQVHLLFSRGVETCRPYLLTLLTHRASWATLHRCVNLLLSPGAVKMYEPSAVLDFLHALTCNPKLWQGREKYSPKHRIVDDILYLTVPQLLCVADYIVEEGLLLVNKTTAILDRMNLHLSLFSHCIVNENIIVSIVKHLCDSCLANSGQRSEMCKQLLLQLYLSVPSIITKRSGKEISLLLGTTRFNTAGSSVLDRMSHTLLTALSATPYSKDWSRRSQELDLATRKMTATHPLLVLRQLTMLASSLRGRVHLDWSVFRQRSHLLLFNQVCGILELMKPHLFKPEYAAPLHETFDNFFALFDNHSHAKEVGHLVTRFVNLLQAYISENAEQAMEYLQTQAYLISDLQIHHPSLGSVCIMMSGAMDSQGERAMLVAVPPTLDNSSPQLDSVLMGLKGPEALSSLQDLDQWSVRKPGILEPAVNDMCELILSPSAAVRNLAHGLLSRYLRCCPSAASSTLPSYLASLNSSNYDVITSTLDRLPEVAVCSQEAAVTLLETVFSIGLTMHINTSHCISKTLALLNIQSGC